MHHESSKVATQIGKRPDLAAGHPRQSHLRATVRCLPLILSASSATALATVSTQEARAQVADGVHSALRLAQSRSATRDFNITAQPISEALTQFGAQSGLTIIVETRISRGVKADELHGLYTADEALKKLLGPVGLKAEYLDSKTVAVRLASEGNAHTSRAEYGGSVIRVARADSAGDVAGDGMSAAAEADTADALRSGSDAEEEKTAGVQEVVVLGAKRKFAPTDSNAATKIPMDVIDTPQSLTVLSSELMNIVGVNSVNTAAALTPSAVNREGEIPIFTATIVRGFKTDWLNGNKINGMPFQDSGGPIDFGIVDRFEVVRGPASIIYGQSGYGATTNITLKNPQAKRMFAGELGYGLEGGYRALLDMTGSLTDNERLRGRLVVIDDDVKTPQDYAFMRTGTILAGLSYDLTNRTTIDATYFHGRREMRRDYGFSLMQEQTGVDGNGDPVYRYSLPKISTSAFLGADLGISKATMDFSLLKITQRLSDNWTLTAMGAAAQSSQLWNEPYAWGGIPADGEVSLSDFQFSTDAQNYTGDVTLTGDVDVLGRKQTLLLNGYVRSNPAQYFGGSGNLSGGLLNVFDPDPTVFSTDFHLPDNPKRLSGWIPGMWEAEDWRLHESALSAMALLHPVDRMTLMLGMRWNEFSSKGMDYFDHSSLRGGAVQKYDDSATTYRTGVVYELTDNANVYGSYSDAVLFNPQKTDPNGVYGGELLPPETGVQYEIGAKAALLNRKLTLAAAVFQVDRRNVPAPDPLTANPLAGYVVGVNGQKHRGLELEAMGEPIPGWNLLASYSYLDVSIDMCVRDQTDACTDPLGWNGHQRANSPHHMAKLYSTYQVLQGPLRGLSLGGGMFYYGAREVDNSGTFRLPAYTQVDLRLGYDALENLSFALNATNVTNADIYSADGESAFGGLVYQARRTVMFRVNFKY